MGQTVTVDGHQVRVDQETTARDLKDAVGAADSDVATYKNGDRYQALADQDRVAEIVPDSAEISFQPAEGELFG
jgi:sulfur carrier protein ThiS